MNKIKQGLRTAAASSLVILLAGCIANKENVLAVTSTVIGVQIHQKDADKTPELKVGYARTEFAFVPTDKGTNGSSANSAEVLMEINAQGNAGLGTAYQGGIYQRLAVGKTAVQQPGAAFMMAKDSNGTLNPTNAEAIQKATAAINAVPAINPPNGSSANPTGIPSINP